MGLGWGRVAFVPIAPWPSLSHLAPHVEALTTLNGGTLPSPPPSHLFLCLKLNEGPAHAGVQRAHQCLSTLSLPPHEQLPRHLTDLLSHTLHQPRLNFLPCLSPKNKSMLFCFICALGGGARRKTHNPPSCPPHHHLSLARFPHCGVHVNATSLYKKLNQTLAHTRTFADSIFINPRAGAFFLRTNVKPTSCVLGRVTRVCIGRRHLI